MEPEYPAPAHQEHGPDGGLRRIGWCAPGSPHRGRRSSASFAGDVYSALDTYVFPIPAAGQKIQRINPNFGQIPATDWSGHSSYHALQANLVQRPIKGLTYQIAYTWSKSIDNGSTTFTEGNESANSAGAPWAFDPRINRGVSDFDIPHNFVANFQYDLPVPAAVKAHALANTLFGGWQVGGIYTRQSGGPFTLKIGADRAFTGNSRREQCQQRRAAAYVCECSRLFAERRHRRHRPLHHDPVLRLSSTGRAGEPGPEYAPHAGVPGSGFLGVQEPKPMGREAEGPVPGRDVQYPE